MNCPKCSQMNEPMRTTCFRCGIVLPKLTSDDNSYQSNINIVIDENIEASEIVSAADCVFLSRLDDLKDYVFEEDWDADFINSELEKVKNDIGYIKELLKSFSDEEKGWMVSGIDQIEQSYYLFRDAIEEFGKILTDNDITHTEEALKIAVQASQLLLSGINRAQSELEKEDVREAKSEEEKNL